MRTTEEIKSEKDAITAEVQRRLAAGESPQALTALGARSRELNRELLAVQGRKPYQPMSDLGYQGSNRMSDGSPRRPGNRGS